MLYPLAWPAVLVPSEERWTFNQGASTGGGRSLANTEQVVALPSGYASATLSIPCRTPAKVLAARALLAGLDGRAGTVLVGPCEAARAPWGIDPITGGPITFRGQQPGAPPPYDAAMAFALATDVALNATMVSVTRGRGGLLSPGMVLSIGNRLHVIVALTTADPADPGTGLALPGTIGLELRPWLRAAYPAGTPVTFGRPLGTMRLATDDTGALDLQLARFGTLSMDLVEAF